MAGNRIGWKPDWLEARLCDSRSVLGYGCKCVRNMIETSNKDLAPQHAMFELGNVILRIVWALATADPTIPFLFTKVDLKDRYWRMCVNAKDA